jgi:hypothetical protein
MGGLPEFITKDCRENSKEFSDFENLMGNGCQMF